MRKSKILKMYLKEVKEFGCDVCYKSHYELNKPHIIREQEAIDNTYSKILGQRVKERQDILYGRIRQSKREEFDRDYKRIVSENKDKMMTAEGCQEVVTELRRIAKETYNIEKSYVNDKVNKTIEKLFQDWVGDKEDK